MRFVFLRGGAVLAFMLTVSQAASAQGGGAGSDASGPGGAGAGVSGMLGLGADRRGAVSVSDEAERFLDAPAEGIRVNNPAGGGSVVVPQAVAVALGQLLSGNSAGASAFTAALTQGGAMSAPLANALVQAILALAANPSPATFHAAVLAYNAAVNGLTGSTVPPALLAVRAALSEMV